MSICRQISTKRWGLCADMPLRRKYNFRYSPFQTRKQEEGTTNGIQSKKMRWQYLNRPIDHIDSSMLNIFFLLTFTSIQSKLYI